MSSGGQYSITEVIGEVTRALVPAITENEIQQRVCEQFAGSKSYSFAWIGRYNPEKEEVIPVASAGIAEDTLDGISITAEPSPQELANEAVRAREVTVRQNLVDDPPCEDWCEHALNHDSQSCAFIPLVYEETLYGVLHLATNRLNGFGTAERESLAELGRTIAYAVETAESPANTDSTARKEAGTELTRVAAEPEHERRLYETIISSTPDLVYAFNLDYRFIFANDALLEMWGQTLEESLGKTLREIGYEPWHAEMHEREIDQVVETKEPIRGEVGFEHAELGRRIYDYIFAPVLNDEGEVEAIAGTTRDITERKEAEEALQKSKERFRALVTASSDVVYRMSPDWNEMQYLEGQDFIADTHESTSDWLDKYIHPDDQPRVMEAIDEAIRTKSTFELEHRVEQVDGSVGWTFSRAVPMLDDDGDIVEWIGMASDITEQKNRERELERVLDLLEKTERIADVGGWEIDVDTQDVFWTDHIFDLLKVDADEEPPLDEALDMYHDEDQPIVEDAVETALASGDPFDVEARVRTDSGEMRWLRLQGVPETVDDEVVSFRGAAQDITEQKERERELKQNKEQLETLLEVLPVGIVVAEDDGEIVAANDTAHEIWGGDVFNAASIEEYEQYPVRWADSGEQVAPEEMTLARVVNGEEITDPDIFEIDAVDGERRIVELEGMPIRDESGEVTRGVVTLSDITERREAQQKLAESERRYRTLADHFPNGVVGVYDHDLRYTLAAGEKLGDPAPSKEVVEGTRMPDLYPDDVVADLEPLFRAAIEDGETGSIQTEVVGLQWQVWATPLHDADGEIFAGLSFAQDITEQIERERRLEELVDELEESNERLERFAYAASHDLQEPLRMVSSYLQLIERRYADKLDEDGREFLAYAVDGADRMREMIQGLLEYSRVDTRGDPFEVVDLNQVVADVRKDLQVKIEESDAEITAGELPDVYGDANQLSQVFQNLLDNAIEYSGDAPPRIHVTAERATTGDKWEISVSDEGVGIDPEEADKVFEVFQSLHGQDDAGTGIGLALCERIVERHGGDIWVDSQPNEGATFSFTLPATST